MTQKVPDAPSRPKVVGEWVRRGKPDRFIMNEGAGLCFRIIYVEGQFYVSYSLCLDIFNWTTSKDQS